MNNVNTLWTEKYRPQSLNDYYICINCSNYDYNNL